MPQYDLNELLFTELLAMDVYHRDQPGLLNSLSNGLSPPTSRMDISSRTVPLPSGEGGRKTCGV